MNKFDLSIPGQAPQAYYIHHSVVGLNDGAQSFRQISTDKEQLFRTVPNSNISEFSFAGAERKDGILHIYFVVLESGESFLYLFGNGAGKSIHVGGAFKSINLNRINHVALENYIITESNKWSQLYKLENWLGLSNSLSTSFNDILAIM